MISVWIYTIVLVYYLIDKIKHRRDLPVNVTPGLLFVSVLLAPIVLLLALIGGFVMLANIIKDKLFPKKKSVIEEMIEGLKK